MAQGSQFVEQARTAEGVDLRSYADARQPIKDAADQQIDAAISDRLLIPYAIRDSQLPVKGRRRRRPDAEPGDSVPEG